MATRSDGMTALMVACRSGASVDFLEYVLQDQEPTEPKPAQLTSQALSMGSGDMMMTSAGGTRKKTYAEKEKKRNLRRQKSMKRIERERRQQILDVQDDKGYTALMHSADAGHAAMVRALILAGANRYLTNHEVRAPPEWTPPQEPERAPERTPGAAAPSAGLAELSLHDGRVPSPPLAGSHRADARVHP